MNYNINNLFQNYSKSETLTNREDSAKFQTENAKQNTVAEQYLDGVNALKDLSVGDVFRAKILDIRNMDVRILLAGNQEVQATMGEALELNIGEELTFQVKANSENGIVLRPVGNSEIPSELVTKSLIGAGISINDKNMAIVKELISNGQPIDRQSIINISKQLNDYQGESIDKLVQMTKHGIEINAENLEQYDKYMNYEHKLSDTFETLTNHLVDYIREESAENMKSVIPLLNDLSQIFDGVSAKQVSSEMGTNSPVSEQNKDTMKNVASEITNTLETITNDAKADITQVIKNSSEQAGMSGDTLGVAVENKEQTVENPAIGNTEYNQIAGSIVGNLSSATSEASNPISPHLNDNTAKIIDSLGNAQSFGEIAEILEQIDKGQIPEHETAKILHSREFQKAIKTIIGEKGLLTLNEERNETKLDNTLVHNLYEKLLKASDMIEKSISSETSKGNNLLNSAKDMKNNIMFMNELNHIASYVQLPLKMNSKHEHGDLYVYGRKREKINSTDRITAFLHLDLDYLGATDINVELVNQSVSVKFTLDNRASEKIVEEHLQELQTRLEEKGYSVNLSAEAVIKEEAKSDKPKTVLSKIFENDDNVSSIKRYSFDIRT